MFNLRIFIAVLVIAVAMNATTRGQSQPEVVISFDKKVCINSIDTGSAKTEVSFSFSEVRTSDRSVSIGSRRLITDDSLFVGDRVVDMSKLAVNGVIQREGF